jgi:acyl-CoA thioester hydrolase
MSVVPNIFNVRIYYEDTDAGGIVFYANYLKFAERARTEWLRELGIHQSTLLESQMGFVVKKVEMDNHASAKLDDLLTVKSTITELKRASLVFIQELFNQNEQLLCTVVVRIACINLPKAKPCAMPQELLGALKRVC